LRTAVIRFLQHLFIFFFFEIAITLDMDPFIALCFVALNPLAWNLFHAYDAVFVIFVIFVAFHTEDDPLFNEILLILKFVRTNATFQTVLTSIFFFLR